MIFHPTETQLNRFADGVLRGDEHAKLVDHLAKCASCSNKVTSIRELTRAAQQLPPIGPREGALDKIEAKRAAGAKVIWPDADPGRSRSIPPIVGLLAATIAVLIVGAGSLTVVGKLRATAANGELRFFPENPTGGDTITVEYRSHPMFGNAERLVLRTRYRMRNNWRPNSRLRHRVVADLVRGKNETFYGQFVLPDSIVYGAFAVEGTSGQNVDSNRRQLWDVVVHTARGVPTLEGLYQQIEDLYTRDMRRAYRAAGMAVGLYPESPLAWSALSSMDMVWRLGGPDLDSVVAYHRSQFARLEGSSARRAALSDDDVAAMMWYGRRVGSAGYERWKTRLYADAPRHRLAAQEKVVDILNEYDSDVTRLEKLEELWGEVGNVHDILPEQGYRAAREIGDPHLMLRWIDRGGLHFGLPRLIDLLKNPIVRDAAVQRGQRQLTMFDASMPARRLLHRDVREQQIADGSDNRHVLAALGRALVATGNIQNGLETLERAAAFGWDLSVFQQLASTKLALGDTTGAVEAFARIAVAPSATTSTVDSVHRVVTGTLRDQDWNEALAEARDLMVERTLMSQKMQSIADDVRLLDPRGERVTLDELTNNGRITLLTFWGFVTASPLFDLPRLQSVVSQLMAEDINVVTILETGTIGVTEPPGGIEQFLVEQGLSFTVYRDPGRESRRALAAIGTPSYFILDREGRIRFEHSQLEDVLRQVAVLKMIQPPSPVEE